MNRSRSRSLRRSLHTALGGFVYLLSLPERSLRAGAAFLGGTSALLTDILIPSGLRGSSSYRITVGLLQAFLIERLAGMEEVGGDGRPALKSRFVQRKLVGNVLEAAGLLTVRLSPLWVFAIAADGASGGKVFVERLVEQLKARGVIAPDAHPKELVEVLEAVQEASGASAAAVDLPPLSREELRQFVEEMKARYARVFSGTGDLLGTFEETWQRMTALAGRERVPLARLTGVMALEAAEAFNKGVGTVAAVGETGWSLVDEAILDSYRRTLNEVANAGLRAYLRSHYRPFVRAAARQFEPRRRTGLERLLLGE